MFTLVAFSAGSAGKNVVRKTDATEVLGISSRKAPSPNAASAAYIAIDDVAAAKVLTASPTKKETSGFSVP